MANALSQKTFCFHLLNFQSKQGGEPIVFRPHLSRWKKGPREKLGLIWWERKQERELRKAWQLLLLNATGLSMIPVHTIPKPILLLWLSLRLKRWGLTELRHRPTGYWKLSLKATSPPRRTTSDFSALGLSFFFPLFLALFLHAPN